ncbi:hypothetical protein BTUL_0108g00160 [Botrytis tulipae]|uniref:RING-type domain-containing protein n=1 Tax=Botrytis tulipae TaxID=87230 RepID=A0A4Z1EJ63_9HELO|nr:hypothetical protein BTUL_0108g00160 [Botrytis tulipae]
MSSRENYISATEELERTEQQNISGNAWSSVAVSLALHPQHQVTVRVDEIPQVTASQDRFLEDANSQELAENVDSVEILEDEGPSGNLTEAGSQPNNQALTLQENLLQDEGHSDTTSDNTPEDSEGSDTAESEELSDIPQYAAVEDMQALHAEIRTGLERLSDIEKTYRNQAIDELLIPVLIDEMQTESVQCPICNEKYDSNAENSASHGACMVPGCKHVFGRECINIWLKQEKKNTCPMCRAKLDIPTDS